MSAFSRIEDPRVLTVIMAALVSAILWIATWELLGKGRDQQCLPNKAMTIGAAMETPSSVSNCLPLAWFLVIKSLNRIGRRLRRCWLAWAKPCWRVLILADRRRSMAFSPRSTANSLRRDRLVHRPEGVPMFCQLAAISTR